jgi:hypothetical protein
LALRADKRAQIVLVHFLCPLQGKGGGVNKTRLVKTSFKVFAESICFVQKFKIVMSFVGKAIVCVHYGHTNTHTENYWKKTLKYKKRKSETLKKNLKSEKWGVLKTPACSCVKAPK